MATKRLRSRIHSHFTEAVMLDLNRLCMDRTNSNNNQKADMILSILDKHGIDYVELGPGTNRMAILIDNYVYKIALDPQGKRDNINEFKISQELQPYVVKTYETNELISVYEYITVISREEFVDQVEDIRRILAILAETYLLGDVGTKEKNFCNWGFRDDGKLVILDFAHIYRIDPDQIVCQTDQAVLDYDKDYHDMICPKCGRKYQFMAVRRLISLEQEQQENIIAKELSYKLTSPIEEFKEEKTDSGYTGNSFNELPSRYNTYSDEEETKEDDDMSRGEEDIYDEESQEESYDQTLERMVKLKTGITDVTVTKQEEQVVQSGDTIVRSSVTETNVDTLDERSQIRVYKQTTEITTPPTSIEVREAEDEIMEDEEKDEGYNEALNEVIENVDQFSEVSHEEDVFTPEEDSTVVVLETDDVQNQAVEPSIVEAVVTPTEKPPLVTIIRTEERTIVDGEIVHDHETVTIENVDDDDEEASALAVELMSGTVDEDEYGDLHERAERDRIESSNRNRRGGKNQWE